MAKSKTYKTKEDYTPEQQVAYKAGALRQRRKQQNRKGRALLNLFK